MITSINRIAQELKAIADAHLQLQSFYYGDIVQTYNSLEGVKHSTLLCDVKNSTIFDGYTTVNIELMVLDRVLTHDSSVKNQPQQDVESDTLQVINDLYWIIRYSERWQAFGMVEEGSAARKVVENTSDRVTGWFITINLRVRNQQGICDLPVIDYDYGQVAYPQNCPGVTIIRDGEFLEIVESGGTFSFVTGSCPDGNIELNGTPVGSVASGATRDIDVLQDGLPVGSWNGTQWIVPTCPVTPCEDITLRVYFDEVLIATATDVPCAGDTTIVIDLLNP